MYRNMEGEAFGRCIKGVTHQISFYCLRIELLSVKSKTERIPPFTLPHVKLRRVKPNTIKYTRHKDKHDFLKVTVARF
jgi:hypothetical protein